MQRLRNYVGLRSFEFNENIFPRLHVISPPTNDPTLLDENFIQCKTRTMPTYESFSLDRVYLRKYSNEIVRTPN